jgi:hypothetical protein
LNQRRKFSYVLQREVPVFGINAFGFELLFKVGNGKAMPEGVSDETV